MFIGFHRTLEPSFKVAIYVEQTVLGAGHSRAAHFWLVTLCAQLFSFSGLGVPEADGLFYR